MFSWYKDFEEENSDMRNALFAAGALWLAGCTAGEQISKIDTGMGRQQVISIMGRPDGVRSLGNSEALTYSNRLMSGFSWDRADYHVLLTNGHVTDYGAGVVRQNAGPNVLLIVPTR